LQITDENIKRLERKFGRDEIEKYLKEFGIGERIEDITNGDARHLLRFKNVDRIRDRTPNKINRGISERNKTDTRKRTSKIYSKVTNKETARRTREMLDRKSIKEQMALAQEKAEKVNG